MPTRTHAAALSLLALTALAACTTPQTTLRNPTTGQVVTCGGNTASSVAGGAIGYSIQRGADNRCVESYVAQGFVVMR